MTKQQARKIESIVESAIVSAKQLYKIQSFECQFSANIYNNYIKTAFTFQGGEQRYQNFVNNLGELRPADQKVLQYAYKQVEDYLNTHN